MALSGSRQEKMFYFSGKVRAFWKDQIFFLDQKNAAVISFENLYINGKKASQSDLRYLDAQVANSNWEAAPEFNAYVVRYPAHVMPSWPYKLKGKIIWLARYAWIGSIPIAVEKKLMGQTAVFMPITYYSGKVIRFFDDKILYGDYRNNVMVNLKDFYINGQRSDTFDAMSNFDSQTPVIHSFVSSLQFLTSKLNDGPEPHLPTWPKDDYGPNTWVAKFAWQGEMPDEFRQHLNRYQILKMNDWSFSRLRSLEEPIVPTEQEYPATTFSVAESAKGRKGVSTFTPQPLLATTQKEAAIVKGALFLANHEYGLINSYLDVIVFSTKNFYVNGDIFNEGSTGLDEYFHEKKIPLNAWIVPLPEPILVFDVYVMWRAVCVWQGIPPKNMEQIKKRYDSGRIMGSVPDALNTASDNRYTLVMGEICHVTHTYGIAQAQVGNQVIEISFKRKTLYLNGYRLRGKQALMDAWPDLENRVWNMLVYPVVGGMNGKVVTYHALGIWQYTHQQYILSDLLFRILLEGGNVTLENDPQRMKALDQQSSEEEGTHMTGRIVRLTPSHGIIETSSVTVEPSYIYFKRTDFYIDGLVCGRDKVSSVDWSRPVNLRARSVEVHTVDKFPITMHSTLVWMGKKSLPAQSSSTVTGGETKDTTYSGVTKNTSSEALSLGKGHFQEAVEITKPNTVPLEMKHGHIIYLCERYGVIQAKDKPTGDSYVLFDFSILWVQGKQLEEHQSISNSIIGDKVTCGFLAYKIPEVGVGGYRVDMQATSAWIGRKPIQVVIPESLRPSRPTNDNESDLKSSPNNMTDYVKSVDEQYAGIVKKLERMEIGETSDDDGLDSPKHVSSARKSRKPYVGKHIKARIIKLLGSFGIAMWHSSEKGGEVYIMFPRKKMYVNCCPIDGNYVLELPKVCNLYVLPTANVLVETFRITLKATCGWIGSKPQDIPAPGTQDKADISLDKVYALSTSSGKNVTGYLVKMMKNVGVARWHSVGHGGYIFIEFKKSVVSDNMKSIFGTQADLNEHEKSVPYYFYVKPMEHKQYGEFTVSLTAINGWVGSKPSHFPKIKNEFQPTLLSERLHVTPAISDNSRKPRSPETGKGSPTFEVGKQANSGLDDLAEGSGETDRKKKRKNKEETWVDDPSEKIDLEGKIIELHSNVGRLQGANGEQYFFSRENSYLYGVCLSNVELWHVLVQDEQVNYRLTELSAGQKKVNRMWIGSEDIKPIEGAAHIYEWCSKNLVPDGARDLLIAQLQVT